MSATASSTDTGGVVLPAYALVAGALQHALEHAASIVAGYTDDDGELYAMQMVFFVHSLEVPANSVIVIPLDTPREDAVLNFAFLASCKSLFLKVHEKPQTRMTYGHCTNFSASARSERESPEVSAINQLSSSTATVSASHACKLDRACGRWAARGGTSKASLSSPSEGRG